MWSEQRIAVLLISPTHPNVLCGGLYPWRSHGHPLVYNDGHQYTECDVQRHGEETMFVTTTLDFAVDSDLDLDLGCNRERSPRNVLLRVLLDGTKEERE